MNVDITILLGLPAAERLALAEILRRSVGCPADIETLELPAWQRAHFDRLLRQCAAARDDPPKKRFIAV